MNTEVLDHFRLDDDPFISLPGGPLLETRDVKQGRKIMDRLIHKGGLGAFIAGSGGGKSTIWRSMAGATRPSEFAEPENTRPGGKAERQRSQKGVAPWPPRRRTYGHRSLRSLPTR